MLCQSYAHPFNKVLPAFLLGYSYVFFSDNVKLCSSFLMHVLSAVSCYKLQNEALVCNWDSLRNIHYPTACAPTLCLSWIRSTLNFTFYFSCCLKYPHFFTGNLTDLFAHSVGAPHSFKGVTNGVQMSVSLSFVYIDMCGERWRVSAVHRACLKELQCFLSE